MNQQYFLPLIIFCFAGITAIPISNDYDGSIYSTTTDASKMDMATTDNKFWAFLQDMQVSLFYCYTNTLFSELFNLQLDSYLKNLDQKQNEKLQLLTALMKMMPSLEDFKD